MCWPSLTSESHEYLKLRWRDVRVQNSNDDQDEPGHQSGSLKADGLNADDKDVDDKDVDDKDGNGEVNLSGGALSTGLSVETEIPPQAGSGHAISEPCISGYSLSVFHNLIQQVLDNQHTIFEKLQQIEGQMAHFNNLPRPQSTPAKNRSSSGSRSNFTKQGSTSNAPTVVWPEGTNVFMQSGSPSTEKKTAEKKASAEKTVAKKSPEKRPSQELSQETLDELKKQAKSQVNFSVKLLVRLTTVAERSGKAVYGNRNKPCLDCEVVGKVKKYYFHMFPSKNKAEDWAKCVSAMNLHLRKMKK